MYTYVYGWLLLNVYSSIWHNMNSKSPPGRRRIAPGAFVHSAESLAAQQGAPAAAIGWKREKSGGEILGKAPSKIGKHGGFHAYNG